MFLYHYVLKELNAQNIQALLPFSLHITPKQQLLSLLHLHLE